MLRRLDDFLIDNIFQKISNFIFVWVGWDNFKVSRFFVLLFFIFSLINVSIDLYWVMVVLDSMFVLFTIFYIVEVEVNQKEGVKNSKRFDLYIIFIKSIFIMPIVLNLIMNYDKFNLENLFFLLKYLSILFYTYFICCDKSTGKRKNLKKKIKNFFTIKKMQPIMPMW